MKSRYPLHPLVVATAVAIAAPQLQAASFDFTFDSHGTAADGDWILSESDCPEADTAIELNVGESGVKQYSSISIHENCHVTFTPRGGGIDYYSNPVRLIVTGDVVIDGTLDLSGGDGTVAAYNAMAQGGQGGAGGFDGGNSGVYSTVRAESGGRGFGPGGGGGAKGYYEYYSFGSSYTTSHSCNNSSSGGFSPATSDLRTTPLLGGSGGGGKKKNE